MGRNETPVSDAIREFLDWHKIFNMRVNCGTFKVQGGGWMKLAPNGTADIMAVTRKNVAGIIDQRVLWIETKAGTKQSDSQKDFQMRVADYGMVFILATRLDDVREWLYVNGFIKSRH